MRGWLITLLLVILNASAQAVDLSGIPRHVEMMHLDGVRPDLLKKLLEAGELPHFQFLLSHGKASYQGSTVDFSETMKVIPAYLTSQRDTDVAGWLQFHRDRKQFRSFWLKPDDVLDYKLGNSFPTVPTIYDVLTDGKSGGENVTAGFSLMARGVPFDNYARAYLVGAESATKTHSYFEQARVTGMRDVEILERIVKQGEKIPAFSMTLFAPADEFGHLEGVTTGREGQGQVEMSISRKSGNEVEDERNAGVFSILDEDEKTNGILKPLLNRYFTRVERNAKTGLIDRVSFKVPAIYVHDQGVVGKTNTVGPGRWLYANPRYVLGMMVDDMLVGRKIEALRSTQFGADGKARWLERKSGGILNYKRGQERSLFEKTLWIGSADHGMATTHHMMSKPDPQSPDQNRAKDSINEDFIVDFDRHLGMDTTAGTSLGIDQDHLPAFLAAPFKDKSWQSPAIQKKTAEAEKWSSDFFNDLVKGVKRSEYIQHWYVYPLKRLLIDPKVDASLEPYRQKVVDLLEGLYLKGDPQYVKAEGEAVNHYYDENVKLVYGGAAKNNLLLFLPGQENGRYTWDRRPSFAEIMNHRGGEKSPMTVIDALKQNPGVGLIFVRKSNEQIAQDRSLPPEMEILVTDRFNNEATITVRKPGPDRDAVYAYRVNSGTDPLGYGKSAFPPGEFHTYTQWNDLSFANGHYYHNGVAGMGALLYSNKHTIGDIAVTHAQGWNFGDNAGGHGGIHAEEKRVFMFASSPEMQPGELMSSGPDGKFTHPTVLDLAPTALDYLLERPQALSEFARSGEFERYYQRWNASEQADLLRHLDGVQDVQEALGRAGIKHVKLSQFKDRIARLLKFIPDRPPELPDFSHYREDGAPLALGLEAGTCIANQLARRR